MTACTKILMREVVFLLIIGMSPCVGSPLSVLIAGEAGVGKSYLSNALLGSELCAEGAAERVTRDCVTSSITIGSQHVNIIDSEGFGAIGSSDSDVLASMLSDIPRPLHLIIFAIDIRSQRLYKSFTDVLDRFRRAFGADIWDRSVLVFTKSNLVADEEERQLRASTLLGLIQQYVAQSTLCGILAGEKTGDWIFDFWEVVLSRASREDSAAFTEIAWNQIKTHDDRISGLLRRITETQAELEQTQLDSEAMQSLLGSTEEAFALRSRFASSVTEELGKARRDHEEALQRFNEANEAVRAATAEGFRLLTAIKDTNQVLLNVRESRKMVAAAKQQADIARSKIPKVDFIELATELAPLVITQLSRSFSRDTRHVSTRAPQALRSNYVHRVNGQSPPKYVRAQQSGKSIRPRKVEFSSTVPAPNSSKDGAFSSVSKYLYGYQPPGLQDTKNDLALGPVRQGLMDQHPNREFQRIKAFRNTDEVAVMKISPRQQLPGTGELAATVYKAEIPEMTSPFGEGPGSVEVSVGIDYSKPLDPKTFMQKTTTVSVESPETMQLPADNRTISEFSNNYFGVYEESGSESLRVSEAETSYIVKHRHAVSLVGGAAVGATLYSGGALAPALSAQAPRIIGGASLATVAIIP